MSSFRGRTYVDIREWFDDGSGELRPSKKGIALKPFEWNKLLSSADKVNDDLRRKAKTEEETKVQLGDNRFESVSSYKGR